MRQNKGLKFLPLLCLALLVSLNTHSQEFSLGICYDVSQDKLCDYGSSSDFEQDSNGSLRPGSYGSTGMNAADQANAHFQARNPVPQQITNQVNHMNQIIQNDTSGKFDETKKKLFDDFTKLSNGNLNFEFLPLSLVPPPLPPVLNNPAFKDELTDFYQQTKDNDFESTKDRVNQTIGKLSQSNPSTEDTFWWDEVRRNHTDSNGILTSLPYQKLKSIPLSTPIQSTQGQYVRQELNNTLSNHAQSSYNYLKECQRTNTCGDKHSAIEPVQLSDARNRMLQKGLKVLDENEAWGYDSGDLANYISEFNNQQNQFNKDFPNPTKEQLDTHNAESLFNLDQIDQEIKAHGQNVGGFTSWPTYRNSNLNNPIEKTNQNSADAATCLAAFNLCQMSGDVDQILARPTIDTSNGPIDPTLLKATAKEKQILDLLGIRKKIEGLTFSGVTGAQYLKDMSRYSLVASAGLALTGAMQESDQFKAIGQEVLDIGLGLIPVVSVGKDAYELFSGKNLVTGKDLSTFDRVMAGVGILSLGTSNYVKTAFEGAGKFIKNLPSGGYKLITDGANKIYSAATKSGLTKRAEILAGGDFIKHVENGNIGSVSGMSQTLANNHSLIKGWKKNRQILNVEDASSVNQRFIDKGWEPPFKESTKAIEFVPTKDEKYVRVYNSANNSEGRWLFKAEAIKGLTPTQIAQKYSLPNTPTHIVDVTVQPGTTIMRGRVARNFGGNEGAIQYLITQDNLTDVIYDNHRTLSP